MDLNHITFVNICSDFVHRRLYICHLSKPSLLSEVSAGLNHHFSVSIFAETVCEELFIQLCLKLNCSLLYREVFQGEVFIGFKFADMSLFGENGGKYVHQKHIKLLCDL